MTRLRPVLVSLVAVALACGPATAADLQAHLVADSAPLIRAGTRNQPAGTWRLRPRAGGWQVGDSVYVTLPATRKITEGVEFSDWCPKDDAVSFTDVPRVPAGVTAKILTTGRDCGHDQLSLEIKESGIYEIELADVRYDTGKNVASGPIVVTVVLWSDGTQVEVDITQASNATVVSVLTLRREAERAPEIPRGTDGEAGTWVIEADRIKRWDRPESLYVRVGGVDAACTAATAVTFSAPPHVEVTAGALHVADVAIESTECGDTLRLDVVPMPAPAPSPSGPSERAVIVVSGVRYAVGREAGAGPVVVTAESDDPDTVVETAAASNATVVPALPGTTTPTPTPTPAPTPTTLTASASPVAGGGGTGRTPLLVGLLVLGAFGTAVAVRRWLALRLRPRTPAELADLLLGGEPARALVDSGPAAGSFAKEYGRDVGEPLLATLVWQSLVGTKAFTDLLRRNGCSDAELVVVRHAGESRHDLLVLDRGYRRRRPRADVIDADPDTRGIPDAAVSAAVLEAARAGRFGIVISRPPQTKPTGCATPAWPVAPVAGGPPAATVGVALDDGSGSLLVTTAHHAVAGEQQVRVGNVVGRVVSHDPATDSSVIAVAGELGVPVRGAAGPLRGVTPRQYEEVWFEGVASGRKSTKVIGWDLGLLDPQQLLAMKVYTGPDTVPGDSGAALVDSTDHVLGFAAYVTGIGEPLTYAVWVWADQVFRAHRLTYGEGSL